MAAFDAGRAPAFDVSSTADPIPLLSGAALCVFALLLTAVGAWLLAGRRN